MVLSNIRVKGFESLTFPIKRLAAAKRGWGIVASRRKFFYTHKKIKVQPKKKYDELMIKNYL